MIGVKPLISIIVQRVTIQPRFSLPLLITIQHVGITCRRAVCAVGVATLNANSVKKQSINAKSERSKCSGLAISRRRQIYAMIGVEFRLHG